MFTQKAALLLTTSGEEALSRDETEEMHEQLMIAVAKWSKERGGITLESGRRLTGLRIDNGALGGLKQLEFDGETGEARELEW